MTSFFTAVSIFGFLALSLFHFETQAAESCSHVFTQEAKENLNFGAQFLHEKDSKLHTTDYVEKSVAQYKRSTGTTLTKPTDKLQQWLVHLDSLSMKAERSPRSESLIKEVLYKQYVMKNDSVPESYYEQQARIARERGQGDFKLSKEQKNLLAEVLDVFRNDKAFKVRSADGHVRQPLERNRGPVPRAQSRGFSLCR